MNHKHLFIVSNFLYFINDLFPLDSQQHGRVPPLRGPLKRGDSRARIRGSTESGTGSARVAPHEFVHSVRHGVVERPHEKVCAAQAVIALPSRRSRHYFREIVRLNNGIFNVECCLWFVNSFYVKFIV